MHLWTPPPNGVQAYLCERVLAARVVEALGVERVRVAPPRLHPLGRVDAEHQLAAGRDVVAVDLGVLDRLARERADRRVQSAASP